MKHIRTHMRKGSVYYTNTFRSYNSLKRWVKHHRLNHGKAFAYRGKNHINGIERFWSYAKHILYFKLVKEFFIFSTNDSFFHYTSLVCTHTLFSVSYCLQLCLTLDDCQFDLRHLLYSKF